MLQFLWTSHFCSQSKRKCKFIPHIRWRPRAGEEAYLHSFSTSEIAGDVSSTSSCGCFYSGKEPLYPLGGGGGGFNRVQLKCDGTRWRIGGKWREKWRMKWVASTLHTTSEYGVSSITTADAHTSAASSRLNWRPRRFKWTRPFRRKTKSVFCACAITFQTQSASVSSHPLVLKCSAICNSESSTFTSASTNTQRGVPT
jgi:hypothetical protein